jgi:hypothetical protein
MVEEAILAEESGFDVYALSEQHFAGRPTTIAEKNGGPALGTGPP